VWSVEFQFQSFSSTTGDFAIGPISIPKAWTDNASSVLADFGLQVHFANEVVRLQFILSPTTGKMTADMVSRQKSTYLGSPTVRHGTTVDIMNMERSKTSSSTASIFLNPLRRTLRMARSKKKRGTNALFRAIGAENWDVVVFICENKPYKAELWHKAPAFFDAHRSAEILPLHQACVFRPSQEALSSLIQAHPMALQAIESGYHRLPIHIACHSGASVDCIRLLLAHHPGGVVVEDLIGRVPLHYALSNGASSQIVDLILNAAMNALGPRGATKVASTVDFNGWLPLHVACFMGASAPVLAAIVRAFPAGVDAKTKKDSTPLSLLQQLGMSEEKKQVLISIIMERKEREQKELQERKKEKSRIAMERLAKMGDETASRGVTLDLEGETSSLSSMEEGDVTMRKRITSRRRIHQEDLMAPVQVQPRQSIPTYSMSPAPKTKLLPTHSIYKDSTQERQRLPTQRTSNVYNSATNDAEEPKRIQEPRRRRLSRVSTLSSINDEEEPTPIFQPIEKSAAFC